MIDAIHTLPPAELRGYARGLRDSAARMGTANAFSIPNLQASLAREAALVDGFAERLESAAPSTPSNEPAKSDQPRPVTPERVAAWAARFEAAALRTVAHPASAVPICTAADAQCMDGCTMPQDGRCARDAPAASPLPTQHGWYRFPDQDDRCKSLAELMGDMPALEPYRVESSEWPGTRYAFLAPNEEGTHEVILSETLAKAHAYLTDLPGAESDEAAQVAAGTYRETEPAEEPTTPICDEAAQQGLADAVAESQATPPTIGRTPAIWTEERDALLAHLYPTLICPDALFGLLSAMPGEPIAGPKAMRQRAAGRGIARQGLPLPEGYEGQPIAGRSPKGMAGTVQAAAPDAARPAPQRSDSPWSEERLALMRRLVPTLMHIDAIHQRINALPGIPVASPEAVRIKAAKLGVHRQGDPIPAEFLGAATSRSRVPQMAEKPAAPPDQAPAPAAPETRPDGRSTNGGKHGTWTAERERILRRDYPGTRPLEDILAEVNSLPGPPVPGTDALAKQAQKLDVQRRAPKPLGDAIPPKGVAPPPMTTEDKAEARERLRTGQSKGALDIIEWFGCSPEEAQQLVDEWRAKQKARAA